MQQLNRREFAGRQHPDRIIQFGEGNFLRAFVDWQIDLLNEHTDLDAGIVVVRPLNGSSTTSLNDQDGLYTALIRGLNEKGEVVSEPRLIRSVNREIHCWRQFDDYLALAHDANIRLVFSNTTEAGIAWEETDRLDDRPASSFPGKLTQLLYERFRHFRGAADKGWILLPCELIDYNGDALKALVLRYAQHWQLPQAFSQWIELHNTFCSTLVDRIVTGYPRDEVEQLWQQLGYRDDYLDTAEVYYQFVIEGPRWLREELRLHRYPLNIRLVDDIRPYKEQKVAILNGAHTALVPVAYLAGLDTVGEAMSDPQLAAFVEGALRDEIIPVLDLPDTELRAFADAVLGRFRNPFIRHQLLSIALNSMTKFRTRILPQLLASQRQQGGWPRRLTFALAALLVFYRGQRHGESYSLQDDEQWLARFATLWPQLERGEITPQHLVETVLADKDHWQQDLTQLPGLVAVVTEQLQAIVDRGVRAALQQLG